MFTIRPLENTAEDHAQWLELWRGYLDFYESEVSAETTAHNWAGFHDPSSPLDALAAWQRGARARWYAHGHPADSPLLWSALTTTVR